MQVACTLYTIDANLCLPLQWKADLSADRLELYKTSQCSTTSDGRHKQPLVVTHTLTITKQREWSLFVHGIEVKASSSPLASFPKLLDADSTNLLLEKVSSLSVCPGNPDESFVVLSDTRGGKFRKGDGTISAFKDSYAPVSLSGECFQSTIRASNCEILVNGVKCDSCTRYRSVLRAIRARCGKDDSQSKTDPSSHTNYR